MRLYCILITIILTSCTTTTRQPAQAPPRGCGLGNEVMIEFPKGLTLPAHGNDKLSQDMGVGAVAWKGKNSKGVSEDLVCTVSNESGKDLSIPPNRPTTAIVAQTYDGRPFFLEKNDAYQFTCTSIESSDRVTLSVVDQINTSLREHVIIHTDACVAMR